MVATVPHNRLGYDSPPPAKIELPQTERERGRLWSDAVFEAVMTLKNQLGSKNEAVAAAAANSILDLERTRIRHDKTVAGSALPNFDDVPAPTNRMPDPAPLPAEKVPEIEVECMRSHAAEVMKAIPGRDGKAMMLEDAVQVVTGFLNKKGAKPSDIKPGEFMAAFGKHVRKTAASAVPD